MAGYGMFGGLVNRLKAAHPGAVTPGTSALGSALGSFAGTGVDPTAVERTRTLRGLGGNDPLKENMTGEYWRQAGLEGAYGDIGTNNYLSRALAFDPSKGLNEWAKSAAGEFNESLGKNLQSLAGQSAGAGRLDTGFFDEDQGELVRASSRDFSRALADQTMAAQQLAFQNQQGLGEFGTNARNTAYDFTVGGLDRWDAEKGLQKKKGGLGSAIGAGLGAIGGSFIGQPLLGAQIGGTIGRSF